MTSNQPVRRSAAIAAAIIAALLLMVPGNGTAQMFNSEENRDVAVTIKRQDPGMPAKAFVLEDLTLVPDSYWAHGGLGDIVLRNDFATFIFGRLPEEGEEPNTQRNGMLLDIFPNPRPRSASGSPHPLSPGEPPSPSALKASK